MTKTPDGIFYQVVIIPEIEEEPYEIRCREVIGSGFDVNGKIKIQLDNINHNCHGVIVFWSNNKRNP